MFRKPPRPEDPPTDAPPPRGGPGGDPDHTSELIDDLGRQLEAALRERDEASENWKRSAADFQNYQRRAISNEQEARRQGVTGVLNSVLPVLDHFDVALTTDATKSSVEQIVHGVAAIRSELLKALAAHGVRVLSPGANEPFDPNQHQAITTQPPPRGSGIEPGHIISTMQAGYAMGDRVVRPAKVIVASAPAA